MADSTRNDETENESDEAAETGATPDEAHRIGEFNELRDMIKAIDGKIDAIQDFILKNAIDKPKPDETDNETSNDDELVSIDDLEL